MTALVLGPNGLPEPYSWAVLYRTGEVVQEQQDGPELTFTRDVEPERVRWIALVPQYQGRTVIRCRVPAGARARFWRRRVHEGVLGIDNSQTYVGSLHEIGWSDDTGHGPSLFVAPDGSVIFGIDDGTLTAEGGA